MGVRQGRSVGACLSNARGVAYLSLEIIGVVVGVLRVHWLLLQSLAHVAGILSTEAGNGDTGGGGGGGEGGELLSNKH